MKDKIKELSKDTILYGISTIVGRFLNFILVPFYTNVFSTTENGVFNNVYAYIAFFNVVYIYGMDAAFMKFYSTADPEKKKNIFSTPYLFVFGSSIFFSLLLIIFKTQFLQLMDVGPENSVLHTYLILILLFDTIALVPFANLRLHRRVIKFTSIKITNIIINLSLNLILILHFKMGIEAIFIANLAASIFSFIALTPDIFKNLHFKIDKEILKKMLYFGLPYLPASVSSMIVQVIDRPLVQAMTNTETLGIYSANYKLGIFMMLFVTMFQFAWQPFFLTNAKEENAKELFSKILTLFLLVSSMIWIVLTLFVDDFARWQILPGKSIIGKEFLSGLPIVPIILLGYLFNGLYYNFQAGLYIEEKTKYFPLVTGLGAVVNVVINIVLIPVWGIMGAALATLAAYITMAAGLFYFSQRVYKIKYEYSRIIKVLSLLFVSCGVYYYLLYNIGLNIPMKFILLSGFIAAIFILRVLNLSEFIKLSRKLLRIG
jgi:O-antigen/teichoic acid export membrane protein